MGEMYVRPMWDKDGNECTLVMRRERRADLPVCGVLWKCWVKYGAEGAGTTVALADVASSNLTNAKALASRNAKAQNFVPRAVWSEASESAEAWD